MPTTHRYFLLPDKRRGYCCKGFYGLKSALQYIDLPALKELVDKASPKDIFAEVEPVFGEQASLGRNVKMFLCQRYTGEKLKDIGTYFGIGESGVSQTCRRIKDKIRNDNKLERKIETIEKKLNVSRVKTCPPCFSLPADRKKPRPLKSSVEPAKK